MIQLKTSGIKWRNEIDAETAEKSDKLNITINFLDENDEVTKSIDRDIVLDENQYSDTFNKNLTGKKVNDEVKTKLFTAKQEIDEADFSEAVKNKEFLVKINSIKRIELPEVNDEFAKDLEYDSLDEMKEKLEADLKVKLETENNNHLKDAIYAALSKQIHLNYLRQWSINMRNSWQNHMLKLTKWTSHKCFPIMHKWQNLI